MLSKDGTGDGTHFYILALEQRSTMKRMRPKDAYLLIPEFSFHRFKSRNCWAKFEQIECKKKASPAELHKDYKGPTRLIPINAKLPLILPPEVCGCCDCCTLLCASSFVVTEFHMSNIFNILARWGQHSLIHLFLSTGNT